LNSINKATQDASYSRIVFPQTKLYRNTTVSMLSKNSVL